MNKKYSLIIFFILLFWITQFGNNTEKTALNFSEIPSDFVYDGCSMVPDWDLLDCCTVHDQGYFFGWTWKERLKVDNKFYSCVLDKWHWYSPVLAPIMWSWVRIWGAPIFPISYRWGFGRDRY